MRKTIAVLGILLPALAFPAAATWTKVGSRSVKAVCASGTCDAPTTSAQGMSLDSVGGFSVTVAADATKTLSGAGTLRAYLYDSATALWSRCPDLDLTVSASSVRSQGFAGFTVTAPRGRIAYVPDGVTVSAGGVTIYLSASSPGGAAL